MPAVHILSLVALLALWETAAIPDHAALLQVGVDSPQLHNEGRSRPGKRLAVFFDGTGMGSFGVLFSFYTGVINNASLGQLAHYEPGVAFSNGHGVRVGALKGLSFLIQHYQPGDQIFLYGASRGCLQARYVQGLISKYGLRKTPLNETVLEHPGLAEEALRSSETWRGAEIEVLGCIDGVLRTLWIHGGMAADMTYMHQEITPSVGNFLHALAIDESRTLTFSAELAVPEGTHQEQVWFGGDHAMLCAHLIVVGGWLAERSQALGGLLLHDYYPGRVRQTLMKSPLPARTSDDGELAIRNPMACRKELYGGRRVKLHASIKDRMEAVDGWKPLAASCYPEALSEENVEWVSTPAYEAQRERAKRIASRQPQWMRVTARFVNVTDVELAREDTHVFLQTPFGSRYMAGVAEHKRRLAKWGAAVFEEVLAFPYDQERYYVVGAVGPCKGVLECSWNSTHHDGRDYRLVDQLTMDRRTVGMQGLSFAHGKLAVSIELLYDDVGAAYAMNATDPQRAWMTSFASRPDDACSVDPEYLADYPLTCEDLRTQIVDGNLHSSRSSSRINVPALPALLIPLLVATGRAQRRR